MTFTKKQFIAYIESIGAEYFTVGAATLNMGELKPMDGFNIELDAFNDTPQYRKSAPTLEFSVLVDLELVKQDMRCFV